MSVEHRGFLCERNSVSRKLSVSEVFISLSVHVRGRGDGGGGGVGEGFQVAR